MGSGSSKIRDINFPVSLRSFWGSSRVHGSHPPQWVLDGTPDLRGRQRPASDSTLPQDTALGKAEFLEVGSRPS